MLVFSNEPFSLSSFHSSFVNLGSSLPQGFSKSILPLSKEVISDNSSFKCSEEFVCLVKILHNEFI
ncbi:hypothetical protein C3B49_14005 [Flavobacterium columnare]|nr:hypothetical protein [Flavobacterium columnare]